MHRWSRRLCDPGVWASSGRRRVLVAGPDAWAWAILLADAGNEPLACHGPDADEQCPLLVFGECPAAAAADDIACLVPEVAAALRERYPLTPLHSSPADLLH